LGANSGQDSERCAEADAGTDGDTVRETIPCARCNYSVDLRHRNAELRSGSIRQGQDRRPNGLERTFETLSGLQGDDKRRAELERLDLLPAFRNQSTVVGARWALHQT
jgi:hypothetical protein